MAAAQNRFRRGGDAQAQARNVRCFFGLQAV
jgi:hypothetical protein